MSYPNQFNNPNNSNSQRYYPPPQPPQQYPTQQQQQYMSFPPAAYANQYPVSQRQYIPPQQPNHQQASYIQQRPVQVHQQPYYQAQPVQARYAHPSVIIDAKPPTPSPHHPTQAQKPPTPVQKLSTPLQKPPPSVQKSPTLVQKPPTPVPKPLTTTPRPQAPSQNISTPSKSSPTPVSRAPSLSSNGTIESVGDYQLLLLALAEQYISVAYSLGRHAGEPGDEQNLKKYRKVMAVALASLETVLRTYRMQPRPEALIRLRYTTLLFEETTNYREAEEALAKGITLCERNRLYDLKYSMQHLLARIIYQTNPRAALKSIDKVLPTVEAEQHTAWIYAFRFLRVSMSLQITPTPEFSAAVGSLHSIEALAESRGDRSIYVTATTLEALVHLRSMTTESLEQVSHAIAAARQWQLGMKGQELAPILSLLNMIDLICIARPEVSAQALSDKMHEFHTILDTHCDGHKPTDDPTFGVVLDSVSDADLTQHTGGIFQRNSEGQDMLMFSWLTKGHTMALGYFLSGVTSFHRNEGRAEKYLMEGLKQMQAILQTNEQRGSVTETSRTKDRGGLLEWYMNLYLVFFACAKTNWSRAKEILDNSLLNVDVAKDPSSELPTQLVTYIGGVISQATGDLDSALEAYQSSLLQLTEDIKPRTSNPAIDLRLVAGLNTLLIICSATHSLHHLCTALLSQLQPLCTVHPNPNFSAAYHLIAAYATTPSTVIHTKQCISQLLTLARKTSSNQLMCLGMNAMAKEVFTGIMGNQPEQCTGTARTLSARWGDPVWKCVSAGMLADTMELGGKWAEAEAARREANSLQSSLPEPLREACMQQEVKMDDYDGMYHGFSGGYQMEYSGL